MKEKGLSQTDDSWPLCVTAGILCGALAATCRRLSHARQSPAVAGLAKASATRAPRVATLGLAGEGRSREPRAFVEADAVGKTLTGTKHTVVGGEDSTCSCCSNVFLTRDTVAGVEDPAVFVTESLDRWEEATRHADYSGLLLRRPFRGRWDGHRAAVDRLHARFGHRSDELVCWLAPRDDAPDDAAWAADRAAAVAGLLRAAALPAPLSEQIRSDACAIACAVGALCSDREVEIKLEVMGSNSCVRWHQDYYGGRAIVSYTGVEGTEYTSDSNVDFEQLRNFGGNEDIIVDKCAIKSADVGDVLFIKGKKYGLGGTPLVHRSPDARYHDNGRVLNRLVLKVDVP